MRKKKEKSSCVNTARSVVGVSAAVWKLAPATQTDAVAHQQEVSGEMWGRPRQYSDIPQVQAYTGPLPHGAAGVEFTTHVPPDGGTAPGHARWTGPRPGVQVHDGFAKIKVNVVKNTQGTSATTTSGTITSAQDDDYEQDDELLAA